MNDSHRSASELTAEERAALSQGSSGSEIYALVERVIGDAHYASVVDVGCGSAAIARRIRSQFDHYTGCDVVAYDGFPKENWASFAKIDLNQPPYAVDAASADLAMSIEVIEHVENPRALMRELVRIAKPGGRVLVTTPNQLSLLSKVSLVTENQFTAFQEAEGLYPAHITALVEIDLRRIASECGLRDIEIHYTDSGRIPFTARHWPKALKGRWFSDNVLLTGTRPAKLGAP
jgi:2-polyprenyl-3-methyl-5-hydroxy-6-metoxy-1,4-benzoquinol methylase